MSPTECTTTVWKRCFYIIWGIRRKVCLRQLDLIEFWSSSSQTSQLELKKLLGWEAKRLQELYQVQLPTTNLPTDTMTWMTENLQRQVKFVFFTQVSVPPLEYRTCVLFPPRLWAEDIHRHRDTRSFQFKATKESLIIFTTAPSNVQCQQLVKSTTLLDTVHGPLMLPPRFIYCMSWCQTKNTVCL